MMDYIQWIEKIPMYLYIVILLVSVVCVTVASVRIYKLKRKREKPTHMVKIKFTEPLKGQKFYENNIKGLKLGLKIRKRDFKHFFEDGMDVIKVRGTLEDMEAFAENRKSIRNEKFESTLKEKTGSIISEELIEIGI